MFIAAIGEKYQNKLQPGDIFIKYEKNNPDLVAKVIQFGQKLRETRHPESVYYTHAGVYIGEGNVAEAGHTVFGDLYADHITCFWTLSDQVHIFRLKDETMARNLSDIAKTIITKNA